MKSLVLDSIWGGCCLRDDDSAKPKPSSSAQSTGSPRAPPPARLTGQPVIPPPLCPAPGGASHQICPSASPDQDSGTQALLQGMRGPPGSDTEPPFTNRKPGFTNGFLTSHQVVSGRAGSQSQVPTAPGLPLGFQQTWESEHHDLETQDRVPGLAHSSLGLSVPT